MKWWQRSSSNEIQPIPWLSPAAVLRLEEIVRSDWEVLEHGSGGSTLWFAEHCKSVIAIEQNPEWRQAVDDQLDPSKGSVVPSLGDIIPSQALLKGKFDLLLIDGEPVGDRAKWLQSATNLVKPGGWVVLDNANRPEYAAERSALQQLATDVETLDANESGTLYLVTDFIHLPAQDQPKKRRKK